MTDKLVQLVTNTQWSNGKAVDFLCDVAEKAADRNVIGAAVITILADGSIGTAWSAGDYNRHLLVGGIELLKRDFMELEIESRG